MERPAYPCKKGNESASQDDFIKDIHKYCDRWCKRCRLSSLCRYYSLGVDQKGMDSEDPRNLTDYYNGTILLNKAMAVEMLTDRPVAKGDVQEPKEHFQDPLIVHARRISLEIHQWFQAFPDGKGDKRIKQLRQLSAGKKRCMDALESICYYPFLMVVKLEKAVISSKNKFNHSDTYANSKGSAKTALIAIDKTVEAMAVIIKEHPVHEDMILDFMIKLSKIVSKTEKRFPDSMNFIRPGLDE